MIYIYFLLCVRMRCKLHCVYGEMNGASVYMTYSHESTLFNVTFWTFLVMSESYSSSVANVSLSLKCAVCLCSHPSAPDFEMSFAVFFFLIDAKWMQIYISIITLF